MSTHTEQDTEINIFKALDFIRDNSPAYAKAKSERIYLEEFRKTKKAILMRQAEARGVMALAAQEREAYANDEYLKLIESLRDSVEEEERLRWLIVAATTKIEVWRTLEANRRAEIKEI